MSHQRCTLRIKQINQIRAVYLIDWLKYGAIAIFDSFDLYFEAVYLIDLSNIWCFESLGTDFGVDFSLLAVRRVERSPNPPPPSFV